MKVIMLKDVAKIGRKGEVKEVADGHAINFLIPRKLVEKATPEKVRAFEEALKNKTAGTRAQEEALIRTLESLSEKTINIKAKVNEKGHLYRELHEKDIVSAIKENFGMDVPATAIKLDAHMKMAGSFKILAQVGESKHYLEVNISG